MSLADDPGLPDYELDENPAHPLPLYSQILRSSECLLQFEPPRRTDCPGCEWIFETKHTRINLGPRRWGLNAPAYGLNGKIEGSIQVTERIQSINATIQGQLRTSFAERRVATRETPPLFLSETTTIYDSSSTSCNTSIFVFSTLFPSRDPASGDEPLPPSYYCKHEAFACEIYYSIRFDVAWNSKNRKRITSKSIGIFYLPKTNPMQRPLTALPPASRHLENPPLFLQAAQRVTSILLPPFFPTCNGLDVAKTRILKRYEESVYLSIPQSQTFTSGEKIPFMLSLCFPQDPFLSEVLVRNVRIHLFKQITCYKNGSSTSPVQRRTLIACGSYKKSSGWAEGVTVLKGDIQAGELGRESSWKLNGVAHQQYILRVLLQPPDPFMKQIPSFMHDEVLRIATSSWGTLDRELNSIGGFTTPAVGLAAQLRQIY